MSGDAGNLGSSEESPYPTRQKSGGALLGDRLRMNFAADPRVFMRSMATRRRHLAINEVLADCVGFLKSLDFDLILIETAGAWQGGTELVGLADVSLYVMTADYGGPTQLERPDEAIDCAPARTRETARDGSLPRLSAAGSLFQVDGETMFELS